MRSPTDAQWLALAVRSETDRPHEWPAVGWVIRNRVEHKAYPDTVMGVVTQAWQFSYFNRWRHEQDKPAVFAAALEGYAGDAEGWNGNDYDQALAFAVELLQEPRWRCPFDHRTLYFWSPVSMNPPGSLPSWDWRTLVCFHLPGLDVLRFVFASERPGHRLAGNQAQYDLRHHWSSPPPVA